MENLLWGKTVLSVLTAPLPGNIRKRVFYHARLPAFSFWVLLRVTAHSRRLRQNDHVHRYRLTCIANPRHFAIIRNVVTVVIDRFCCFCGIEVVKMQQKSRKFAKTKTVCAY
jgi:hypothetical protein